MRISRTHCPSGRSSVCRRMRRSSPYRVLVKAYPIYTTCSGRHVGRKANVKKNKNLEWRVRAVPIKLAIGPDDLSSATLFPCVLSIINVPVNASTEQRHQNPEKT